MLIFKSTKSIVVLLGSILLLAACKPSDKYAGECYVVSNDGEMLVDCSKEKVLTVEDEEGQKETYDFNQHSTGFITEVSDYGIERDGKDHYVVVDDQRDEDNDDVIVHAN